MKLDLSNDIVKRPASTLLNDTLIDELIKKYEYTLKKNVNPVVTVVTNKARVFFIDANLNVMMVDLKANQGADYLMYDYEFETIAYDDDADENAADLGEEVYGYLILELIKENGNLIFLKRISEFDKLSLKDSVKVVDKLNAEVKLGKNYGWIDCLLLAKDMVSKEYQTATNGNAKNELKTNGKEEMSKAKPVGKKTIKAKRVTPKPSSKPFPRPSTSRSPSTSSTSKFAYAAAAAAHR